MLDPIQIRLIQAIHEERIQEAMYGRRTYARPFSLGLIERMRAALSTPANQPAKLAPNTPRKAHS